MIYMINRINNHVNLVNLVKITFFLEIGSQCFFG